MAEAISPEEPTIWRGGRPTGIHSVTEQLLDKGDANSRRTPDGDNVCVASSLRSVGWYGFTTLLGGILGILAALAFLSFLWAGDSNNVIWQRIMLAGWATRSITIAAVVIRLALAAQATICTSMIAALMLQHYGIPLSRSMSVSVARAQSTSPHSFAWLLLPKYWKMKNSGPAVAVAILVLTTTFSQFTSTILLSGVQLRTVTNTNEVVRLFYGISNNISSSEFTTSIYWQTKPDAYPAVAEYTESPVEAEGIHDTGMCMRALLPFSALTQREMMKSYDGRATVVDSRVMCARPQLQNLSFSGSNTFSSGREAPFISGLVGTNMAAPGLYEFCNESCRTELWSNTDEYMYYYGLRPILPPQEALFPFECSSAIAGSATQSELPTGEVPVAVCIVGSWTTLQSPLWVYSNTGGLGVYPGGQAYLIIQTAGSYDAWDYLGHNADYADLKLQPSFGDGEWLTYPVKTSSSLNASISFSLCFATFPMLDMDIHAIRDSNSTEPEADWDKGAGAYNTTAVRRQLNVVAAENLTIGDRGIFKMHPQANWSRPEGFVDVAAMSLDEFNAGNYTDPEIFFSLIEAVSDSHQLNVNFNFSLIMCEDCDSGDKAGIDSNSISSYAYPHALHSQIFGQIIFETKHPALALQSLFTIMLRSAYYDAIDRFDIPTYSNLVTFVEAQVPTNTMVLAPVVAVVCLHLTLTAYLTLSFVRRGTLSLLGNVWSAVGQVCNSDTQPWLNVASNKTDKEVEQLVEEDGEIGICKLVPDGAEGAWLRKQVRDD